MRRKPCPSPDASNPLQGCLDTRWLGAQRCPEGQRGVQRLPRDQSVAAFTIYFDNLIHLMMVDVDMQRMGIGSQLLNHSEQRLFASDRTIIRLETFEGNQQAINFYLKNGWTKNTWEPPSSSTSAETTVLPFRVD